MINKGCIFNSGYYIFVFFCFFLNLHNNNSSSLQQKLRNSILDASLISRQYKLKLMAKFMQLKFENTKMKQSEIADQLGYSTSTLQFIETI